MTQNETLVISRTEDGFRVYSPSAPSKSYIVSGSPEDPTCTCLGFEQGAHGHHCKHIQAVLNQLEKQTRAGTDPDPYEAEEGRAIQEEGRPSQGTHAKPVNGTAQMLLKRSVSPDGRIDSLSVEFSCPVDGAPAGEIKARAIRTLKLQADIVESFLNGTRAQNTQPNQPDHNGNGATPGRMLTIGGLNTKWGRRLFINVQVNGETLKLFGNRKQLADAIATAGFPNLAERIDEGVHLNVPCQVITKPSEDGRYVNIDRVLPAEKPGPQRRGRP